MKCPCENCICLSICRWKKPSQIINDCELAVSYLKKELGPDAKQKRASMMVDILWDGVNEFTRTFKTRTLQRKKM